MRLRVGNHDGVVGGQAGLVAGVGLIQVLLRSHALVHQPAGAAEALLGVRKIGLRAAHLGRVANVLNPFLVALQSQSLQRLAQLGLVLRQQVALLFVGDAHHGLAGDHAVTQIHQHFLGPAFHLGADDGFVVRKQSAHAFHLALQLAHRNGSHSHRHGTRILTGGRGWLPVAGHQNQ